MQRCVIVFVLQVGIRVVFKEKTGDREIRLMYTQVEGGDSIAILSIHRDTMPQQPLNHGKVILLGRDMK